MSHRVIVWASGRTGGIGVRAIQQRNDLELVGLWVHSERKAGQDAGTLCGIDAIGISASNDVDALLALDADAVFYTAGAIRREEALVDDLERILRSGKNVVNVSHPPLVHPATASEEWNARLEDACAAGSTSLYTSGVDPGYVGTLALAALGGCQAVRTVRLIEIINYSDWDSPWNLRVMGFGHEDVSTVPLLCGGALVEMWGPAVALIAEGLGLTLDDIEEFVEVERADVDFEIPAGPIPKGTISAMRFEIRGIVAGEPRVVVEHVTRLREDDAPTWAFGDGYRVVIDGEPRVQLDIGLSSDLGNTVHAAYVATAMPLVNAIPAVCAAPPGVLTDLDLPPRPATAMLPM